MDNGKFKSNQSVEKVLQIIETLANNKRPMRLQEISEQIGIPSSTAMRFLKTLLQQGYVSQNPDTLRYSLTMKICRIGDLVSSQLDIRELSRPALTELTALFGESSCLAIEENHMAVYIDVIEGANSILKVTQRIGKIAPLHCTGVGKALLLNYTDKELERYIDEYGLPKLTNNTITTKSGILRELAEIRENLISIDNEECELGVICVAAPVFNYSGKVVACISITGPSSRMTQEKIQSIIPVIRAKAKQISKQLA